MPTWFDKLKARFRQNVRHGGELPPHAIIGDALDWNAPWVGVALSVELPFWLMVSDCTLSVTVEGHAYETHVEEHYAEIYVREITDSRATCVFQGPFPPPAQVMAEPLAKGTASMLRKAKTCLRISTRCNADVCAALAEKDPRRVRTARLYLQSLCTAHIPVANLILQSYILQTFDPLVHEVSPWDVPHWFMRVSGGDTFRVTLLPAADWDLKPVTVDSPPWEAQPAPGKPFEFATGYELQTMLDFQETPGELELATAMHLRQRGDYASAVRRSVTAVEVVLEHVLRLELSKRYGPDEVNRRLYDSRNDFPGRCRQYEKLSGRDIPVGLKSNFEKIRDIRHDVVHRGRRVPFQDRGTSNYAVDNARFMFNCLEDVPEARARRERLLVPGQLGVHRDLFPTALTPDGPVVKPVPSFDRDERS